MKGMGRRCERDGEEKSMGRGGEVKGMWRRSGWDGDEEREGGVE